jgi:hypothetical protein
MDTVVCVWKMCIYENQGKLATEDIAKRIIRRFEGMLENTSLCVLCDSVARICRIYPRCLVKSKNIYRIPWHLQSLYLALYNIVKPMLSG